MPRAIRTDVGNYCYHIINRANARLPIFFKEEDYELFENTLEEAKEKYNMRILVYCLMPNHFHLVLYPKNDGDLGKFMQWLTLTHTQRWHQQKNTKGTGHLYQGRYKSFIIEKDNHLLSVLNYVECNAFRAKLVKKAENWKFCSLWRKLYGNDKQKKLLSVWPISEPDDYLSFVNTPQLKEVEESIRLSVIKGKPYGNDNWSMKIIKKFGLESTIRLPWRPKKGT
ncbi:transposase [Patescibacteria group bacterium]|nr:transposase [Patescibacteria group bacterium]MBU4115842.1 transposase [Patescibacteria group bacterium]